MEKKKVKKKTPKQLKKTAWDLFSKMVRLKYSYDDGLCQCYTCGKIDLWKNLQAGHGIGGRRNYILLEEEDYHTECRSLGDKLGFFISLPNQRSY